MVTGGATWATSGRVFIRVVAAVAALVAAALSTAPPDGEVISTFSTSGSAKLPSLTIWSARLTSPMFWSSSCNSLMPVDEPIAKQAATKTSQVAIARHGCSALQRATRTVVELLDMAIPLNRK